MTLLGVGASFVLDPVPGFPADSTVELHAESAFPGGASAPIGATLATAVTDATGHTTFTGLGYNTNYWAYAPATGQRVRFRTDTDPGLVPISGAEALGLRTDLDAVESSILVIESSTLASPLGHGAVGGGVVDDTAGLQAAFDTGGVFIDRDYKATSTLTAPDGLVVNGPGRIIYTGASTACIDCEGAATFDGGVQIVGPYPSNAYAAGSIGIRVVGADADHPIDGPQLLDCNISGFGDSGSFWQYVTRGKFTGRISGCGRDGLRGYSVTESNFSDFHVSDITPGFGGNAGYENAYGLTLTRYQQGTNTTIDPPSADCIVEGGVVEDVPTWKGLDTHGGQRIAFIGNMIRRCYIGIGIDEGDNAGENGTCPPRWVTALGNTIDNGAITKKGPGITCFAPNEGLGESNRLVDNTLIGCGSDEGTLLAYGALAVSNQNDVVVSRNTLIGSLRAAATFKGTVRNGKFHANTIVDLVTSVTINTAVMVESATVQLDVDKNSYTRTTGTFVAYSFASPSGGYGVTLGVETFNGTITKFAASAQARVQGGMFSAGVRAWASITNNGTTAAISFARGVASVARVTTGQVTVTLTDAYAVNSTCIPFVTPRVGSARHCTISNVTATTFDVFCWDAAGAAVDAAFDVGVLGL